MRYSKFPSELLEKLAKLSVKVLLIMILEGCAIQAKPVDEYYNIIPVSGSKMDIKWASYLYTHMQNRSNEDNVVVKEYTASKTVKKKKDVRVHLDVAMKDGCKIHYLDGATELTARDEEHMLWLIYQFIGMSGETDDRIDVSDLPPSLLKEGNDTTLTMPFEYRSIYSASNRNEEMFGILGAGNIDYDWAIWGHNFGRMLENTRNEEVYALVDGTRLRNQYCFSSYATWDAVSKWIKDNYGLFGSKDQQPRFVIMPNDNDYVCLCPTCRALGNTASSASGAVMYLVNKLAEAFPDYLFFTSSYLTTQASPSSPMPSNTGVLISAMEIPFNYHCAETPEAKKFSSLIARWKRVTNHVYVWDYSRNFDNYFISFPVLSVLQERLRLYRTSGVNGVVFNDSGETFATFGDMQTFVMSSLLIDPDIDVDSFVVRFLRKYYPHSAEVLSDYYLTLERRVRERNIPLEIYGGVDDAVRAYLKPKESLVFFHRLDSISKQTEGQERTNLNQLLTALSYSMIELIRTRFLQVSDVEKDTYLDNFTGYSAFPDMKMYREDGFTPGQYISYMKENPTEEHVEGDLLYGKKMKCSALEEEDLDRLTDGMLGIPMDWNVAWSIAKVKGSLVLYLPALSVSDFTLTLGFLCMGRWNLGVFMRIEIRQEGKICGEASNMGRDISDMTRHVMDVPVKGARAGLPTEIHIFTTAPKLAIDEVVARTR